MELVELQQPKESCVPAAPASRQRAHVKPLALPCCHSTWASKRVTSTAVAAYGAIPAFVPQYVQPHRDKKIPETQEGRQTETEREAVCLTAGGHLPLPQRFLIIKLL